MRGVVDAGTGVNIARRELYHLLALSLVGTITCTAYTSVVCAILIITD